MLRLVLLLLGSTLVLSSCVFAQEEIYERYLFNRDLNNAGTAGGPAQAGPNLQFVALGEERQAAQNTLENPEEIWAVSDMTSAIPAGQWAIRISAWIKTSDWYGAIRELAGTGRGAQDKDWPCSFQLGLADGKLMWSARGANWQNQNLRGSRLINDGQWHYVTAVSTVTSAMRAVVALYVDGKLDAQMNCWASQMAPTTIERDTAFSFIGQLALLETAVPSPGFMVGTGEEAQAAAEDPTWAAAEPPPGYVVSEGRKRVTADHVVNVEDFGATGNGFTDDTEALQQAVAALDPAAGKDTLFFPPGIYLTTQSLVIPGGVDLVGVGAELRATDTPAIELVGDLEEVSFWDLHIHGGPPAAVYQHGGTARHLYFQSCLISAPSDPVTFPDDPRVTHWMQVLGGRYEGRSSHGLLFTDVEDSTIVHGSFTAGLAGIAVEGRMRNLAVLRVIVTHSPNLVGFYFNTPEESSCLLLNNTVHCNKGYVIKAPVVSNLVMRGMSTEANGIALPADQPFTAMYDIFQGTNVDLEMINLAPLSWRREGDRKWDGAQLRLDGQNNTVAGAYLIGAENTEQATLDSNDPNLTLWGINFRGATLNLSGEAQRQVILGSEFDVGNYTDTLISAGETSELNLTQPTVMTPPISPEQRLEPELWGPPARRFTWGELGLPSVRDYGAVGDGQTDDTQALLRALSRGGIFHVPAGTYLVSQSLHPAYQPSARYPGFSLLGEGMDSTTLQATNAEVAIIEFPWRGKFNAQGTAIESAYDASVSGCNLYDLSLVGGTHGVLIELNTADWFVDSVRFEGQSRAGFAADSFDNGNVLVNCQFEGADYGFIAGGWNRCFVDKTFLWNCDFNNQGINGIVIGSVPDDQGNRPAGLWMHVCLRDCTVRNSSEAGVVIMSTGARPNFLDHCLIENCGRNNGAPYVAFVRGGGTCAAAYHTVIRRTSGPLANPLLNVENYTWARFQEVAISGAEGGLAARVSTPYCWLERVTADGTLDTPGGYELVDWSPGFEGRPMDSATVESRLIDRCQFTQP